MSNVVMLNEDVLWIIFILIAEDDKRNMSNKLQCVLNGSLVCRQWRQFLLSATNIWGRLISVDSDRLCDKKPTVKLLELITQRSRGTSPLFIEATATRKCVDTKLRLFLCRFMEEAWERIQEIHFEMTYNTDDQQIRKRTRAVIGRPSPNLRVFCVYGEDFRIMGDNDFDRHSFLAKRSVIGKHYHWYPFDYIVPAFANFAPRLEEFLVCDVYFPPQAPWLSNLRSLVVGYGCTRGWFPCDYLSELLGVLVMMPCLESIEVNHLHRFARESIHGDTDVIDLPDLEYMMLWGPPEMCGFVHNHIRGAPSGCMVKLNIEVFSRPHTLDESSIETHFWQRYNRLNWHLPQVSRNWRSTALIRVTAGLSLRFKKRHKR
ncbi:hypothetical protein D9613_004632 [Agrocybe pediades]|uniref:F-box domain-containing protein n=1 Tax=Agrocybe pediades TaxID=84607 RepID=A0A8H4R094_9AGAR|nr:hypothetical protein D9613_004632 [Agrocybe pediades]